MKKNTPPVAKIEAFADFASRIAWQGGQCARKWFRTPYEIDVKNDKSPVTVADRTTEGLIREAIIETFPDHGILGEEYGEKSSDSEYVWVIDPIDGTRSFITGSPLWGTLIALLRNGKPIAGVIEMPALGERWLAYDQGGCWFTDRSEDKAKREVSKCTKLKDAKFYTTHQRYFSDGEQKVLNLLMDQVRESRYGGDCYLYCLLASGYIDVVAESMLHPFDYLALVPVVEEAGGIITDWEGQPLTLQSGGRVVAAATRELHSEALAILKNYKKK